MNSVLSVCSTWLITSFCTVSMRSIRMITSTEKSRGSSESTRAAWSGRSLERITATVCGYSCFSAPASTDSLTLESLSHIVRPEGPRMSSMISFTLSPGRMPVSRRSVVS